LRRPGTANGARSNEDRQKKRRLCSAVHGGPSGMGMAYEQKNPNLPISIPLVAERDQPTSGINAFSRRDQSTKGAGRRHARFAAISRLSRVREQVSWRATPS
jgi:hypothetical protein